MGQIIDKKGTVQIERKTVGAVLKAVGAVVAGQPLIIEGYASTYGSETDLDRDGEFVDGAENPFEHPNGIPLFMKNPVILADHENGTQAVVGRVSEYRLDAIGLWVRVEIPDVPNDPAVQTVRQKVAAGLLRAFSIGGRFYREWLEKAVKIIRVDLWEISIVAVPSRQTALFAPVSTPDLPQPAQRGAGAASGIERKTVASNPQQGDTTVKVTVRRKNAQGTVETLVIEKSAMQAGDELVTETPAPAAQAVEVVADDEPTEDEIQAAVAKAATQVTSKAAKLQAAVDQRLPAYLAGMNQGSKMVHGSQKTIGAPAIVAQVGEKAIGDYESLVELLGDLKSGKISGDQKAMTSSTLGNAGYLIPDKFMEVDEKRQGAFGVQDMVTTMTDANIEVVKLTRPNADLGDAVGTAQNTARAEGDLGFEQTSRSLLTLTAPLVAIANQMLRRGGNVGEQKVRAAFQRSMRRGRENWIIAGTGSGQQPTGILNETGIGLRSTTVTTAAAAIDAVRDAMVALEIQGYVADAVAMRPESIAAIEKAKDSQGRYLLQGVQRDGAGQLRIYGLLVGSTLGFATNLGAGTDETRIIVGEFGLAEYYRVGGVLVDFSEHYGFNKSLTYFRCEEEATFQCWEHPKAFYAIPAKTALT